MQDPLRHYNNPYYYHNHNHNSYYYDWAAPTGISASKLYDWPRRTSQGAITASQKA
jgi:hypothetical protein